MFLEDRDILTYIKIEHYKFYHFGKLIYIKLYLSLILMGHRNIDMFLVIELFALKIFLMITRSKPNCQPFENMSIILLYIWSTSYTETSAI